MSTWKTTNNPFTRKPTTGGSSSYSTNYTSHGTSRYSSNRSPFKRSTTNYSSRYTSHRSPVGGGYDRMGTSRNDETDSKIEVSQADYKEISERGTWGIEQLKDMVTKDYAEGNMTAK